MLFYDRTVNRTFSTELWYIIVHRGQLYMQAESPYTLTYCYRIVKEYSHD